MSWCTFFEKELVGRGRLFRIEEFKFYPSDGKHTYVITSFLQILQNIISQAANCSLYTNLPFFPSPFFTTGFSRHVDLVLLLCSLLCWPRMKQKINGDPKAAK